MVRHLLGMQAHQGLEESEASQTTTNFNTTNNPTASTSNSCVSDRDRHLFHFGTETTIGNSTTQDPMFVRFSNQEDLNTMHRQLPILQGRLD